MKPWLEAAAVAFLALAGAWLGQWFSRLRTPYWLVGYILPLVLVVLYGLASHYPALSLEPPFSWLVLGRNKFATAGFVATMILTTPLSRIRPPRARRLIALLMALVVIHLSVWPFLAPAFNYRHLASLRTRLDANGICIQSNDYNCGPAAAVTALRRLGFAAEEGEIAILAHTSSATGTPPDVLAHALQERYGQEGLKSEFRVFKDLEELRAAGLALAVIRYTFWFDHYVTVFEVTDDEIIAADPSLGLVKYSKAAFLARWRFVGVVLKGSRRHAHTSGRSADLHSAGARNATLLGRRGNRAPEVRT